MSVIRLGPVGLSLVATLSVAQGPTPNDAGSRMMPLPAVDRLAAEQRATRSTLHCNAMRDFCLRAWREDEAGGWLLNVHRRVPMGADVAPVFRSPVPPSDEPARETMTIWPHLIRDASGALLFGVLRSRSTGFSGGGASETHLLLFRQSPGETEAREVLTVQTHYGAMIRACFTEEDYRSRGACQDEYEYAGAITLAPGAADSPPRLAYRMAARSYPRGARSERSDRPRLRRSDLVWEPDRRCSYQRILSFDATSRRYAPDRPLPAICSTYTLP